MRLFRRRLMEAGQRRARFLVRNRTPHAPLQLRSQEDAGASGVPGLRIPVDLPRGMSEIPPWPARPVRRAGLLLRGLQDGVFTHGGPPAGRGAKAPSKKVNTSPARPVLGIERG